MSADIKKQHRKISKALHLPWLLCCSFFFVTSLTYNIRKTTGNMMKRRDIHMEIQCNCACWSSIQYPRGWEIWVCSIWSALQISGVCNIWRLLHIHKTFSVGRTELIITGFGKMSLVHWSKLSSRSSLIRHAQRAEMKRAAQLVKWPNNSENASSSSLHWEFTQRWYSTVNQTCADD